MSTVRIPPTLRTSTGGAKLVDVPGGTVREVIAGLVAAHPALGAAADRPGRRPQPLRQRVPQRHRRAPPPGARHPGRRDGHARPAAGDGRRLTAPVSVRPTAGHRSRLVSSGEVCAVTSSKVPSRDNEAFWRDYLTRGDGMERRARRVFRLIPHEPAMQAVRRAVRRPGGARHARVRKVPCRRRTRRCATAASPSWSVTTAERRSTRASCSRTSVVRRRLPSGCRLAEFHGLLDRFYVTAAAGRVRPRRRRRQVRGRRDRRLLLSGHVGRAARRAGGQGGDGDPPGDRPRGPRGPVGTGRRGRRRAGWPGWVRSGTSSIPMSPRSATT